MIGVIKKLMTPSAVSSVDERLDEIRAQMTALAEAEASAQSAIDALTGELRSDLDAGLDTTEVEGKILSARRDLERLALRRGGLEKLASEKTRVLKEKRHRARVAALEQAEVAARAELATLDEEIIEDILRVSEKLARRAKLEHDTFSLCARLQHLGGIPRGVGDLAWDEAPLVAEFLRRHHPEATRPLPFGEQPWRPVALTVPVLTPDRTTTALVADDEIVATA